MRTNLYIMIVILLAMTSPIFGDQLAQNSRIYDFGVSFGVANGCTVGLGKILNFEKKSKEITYNLHYLQNSDYFVTGMNVQINSFRNNERNGFFSLFTVGLDYAKGKEYQNPIFGIPGGPNEGDNDKINFERIHPILSIGYGYCMWLSNSSRILIFLDLGIKIGFSNLNIIISF